MDNFLGGCTGRGIRIDSIDSGVDFSDPIFASQIPCGIAPDIEAKRTPCNITKKGIAKMKGKGLSDVY